MCSSDLHCQGTKLPEALKAVFAIYLAASMPTHPCAIEYKGKKNTNRNNASPWPAAVIIIVTSSKPIYQTIIIQITEFHQQLFG